MVVLKCRDIFKTIEAHSLLEKQKNYRELFIYMKQKAKRKKKDLFHK